jgi:hypothetical protein
VEIGFEMFQYHRDRRSPTVAFFEEFEEVMAGGGPVGPHL